jgi:hypothetical protein
MKQAQSKGMVMNVMKMGAALIAAVALASCGGGGPVAGDAEGFSVSPEETTWTVSSCAASGGGYTIVTINGGQPPFRIVNSAPQFITVDRTEVTGKDPTFRVSTLRGCGEDLAVTVIDYHSRTAIYSVTIEEEEEE